MDRMEQAAPPAESALGDQQYPLADFSLGPAQPSGQSRAGAIGSRGAARLARALGLWALAPGNVRRPGQVLGDLLPNRRLEPVGQDHGPGIAACRSCL